METQFELQIRYFPSEAHFEFSENFLNNLAYWKAQRDIKELLSKIGDNSEVKE